MGPIDCLGISRAALYAQVRHCCWEDWRTAEPELQRLGCLEELRELRGAEADQMLGALLRLAARDGSDEQLAATAVAHQMDSGMRKLAYSLRDMADDIDPLVMGTLWMEIRCFPWRRRSRSYATNLLWDTRSSVMRVLLPSRTGSGYDPVVLVDPQSPTTPLASAESSAFGVPGVGSPEESRAELQELLDWALHSQVISPDDVALLLELIEAGLSIGIGSGRTLRGICSQEAVQRVAERRRVCGKTVRRRRDRAVAALRDATSRYLREVA